jgi:hypothetical protein
MNRIDDLRDRAGADLKTSLNAVAVAARQIKGLLGPPANAGDVLAAHELADVIGTTILPVLSELVFSIHACKTLHELSEFRGRTDDPDEFVTLCRDHAETINTRRVDALSDPDGSAPCSREMERAIVRYASHVQLSVVQAALADLRDSIRDNN